MRLREAFPDNLRKLLKAECKRSGTDVANLCRRYGFEKKKLYMYMRGDSVPNLTTAYQLSKLLHCDINDFLEGVNE